MRCEIDKKGNQPAYLQLYRQLREDIVAGAYPYRAKLPSKRSGYFVTYRESDGFAVLPESAPPVLLPPRAPENEFPFSVFAKTMRRVLSRYGERLLVKSPNNGLPELRDLPLELSGEDEDDDTL